MKKYEVIVLAILILIEVIVLSAMTSWTILGKILFAVIWLSVYAVYGIILYIMHYKHNNDAGDNKE